MTKAAYEDQLRLLDLQAVDTRRQQIAHRRRTLPVLADVAELEKKSTEITAEVGTVRIKASDLKRELTKAEDDVEQVRARITRNTERLDAGHGTARDLKALQDEIVSLNARREDLEDAELVVLEQLDECERALADLEARAGAVTAELTAAIERRDGEWAQCDTEDAAAEAERSTIAASIEAKLLALYERIREQRDGLAASALTGNRCGSCRIELNPGDLADIVAAPKDDVVRCEECGRILVRVDA